MKDEAFRKTNHLAVAGFLLPFVAVGVAGVFLLFGKGNFVKRSLFLLYAIVVPMILFAGLICSFKSIPRIRDLGDKDYAYSGLTVNLLFLLVYLISLFSPLKSP